MLPNGKHMIFMIHPWEGEECYFLSFQTIESTPFFQYIEMKPGDTQMHSPQMVPWEYSNWHTVKIILFNNTSHIYV